MSPASSTGAAEPPSTTSRDGHLRAPAPQTSPLQEALAGRETWRTPAAQLDELAGALLAQARLAVPGSLLLVSLPPHELARAHDPAYRQLCSQGVVVVLLARDLVRHVSESGREPHRVPLRGDDPLYLEWDVVLAGPDQRTGFLSRAVEEDSSRLRAATHDWALLRDPEAVGRAAAALLLRTPHLQLQLPALRPVAAPAPGASLAS
ncbi:MAG TPA: hypothetical protein VNE21_05085 [Mycobacteriales bacterium]|nr:hypothetical protein [Mycobacteriales bacterium]